MAAGDSGIESKKIRKQGGRAMNFDFSEEQNLLREQARRFLAENAEGKAGD